MARMNVPAFFLLILFIQPIIPLTSGEISTDLTGTVNSVYDGDTFYINSGATSIRLADINAPEIGQTGATQSRDYLYGLVYGKTVYLDQSSQGGLSGVRLVCMVYTSYNSTHYLNINKKMLDAGRAAISDDANDFNPYTWTPYVSKSAGPKIVINEIEENPAGTDSGNEWVELYNPNGYSVNIGGWSIATNHGSTYRATIPTGTTIKANSYYIVTRNTQWVDNSDDYLILREGNGVEIDRSPVLVDTSDNSNSWQRYPNGKDTGATSDWSFRTATKGFSNGGVTSTLTVTSPNTALSWVRGTVQTLTWTSTGSPGINVKIELLKSGVVNRVISSSTANDGSYSWTIPTTQTAGTDYKIRITSTTDAAITDSSNANFAITVGALTVTSPNGGQSWVHGTAHTITWSSSGNPGTIVKIELLKAGVVNRVISSSTANDGSYSWTIPSTQTVGSDYRIRITSTTNTAITDQSNANFAIIT